MPHATALERTIKDWLSGNGVALQRLNRFTRGGSRKHRRTAPTKRSRSSGISVTPLLKVTIKRIVTQERAQHRLISPKKQPLHRDTLRYPDIRRQPLHRISRRQRHRHTEPTITNRPTTHRNRLPQRVRNNQRTPTNRGSTSRLDWSPQLRQFFAQPLVLNHQVIVSIRNIFRYGNGFRLTLMSRPECRLTLRVG